VQLTSMAASAEHSRRDGASRHNWRTAVAWVYYAGLCVLMVLIITKVLKEDLLPGPVGRHISNDSEGYVLALLLGAWIEFARPRLTGRRTEWLVTVLAAVVMFLIFIFLYNTHAVIGTVKTLNETFFALAILIPYIQLARRPSVTVAWGCALGLLVATIVLDHTSVIGVVTALAEGVVMLILAPVAFDVADRGILTPDRPSPLRVRQAWWTVLVVLPLLFIVTRHAGLGGPLGAANDYATRAQEAFVGMFLLEIYFAIRQSNWLNPGHGAPAGQGAIPVTARHRRSHSGRS
jgi:hypothetical protein